MKEMKRKVNKTLWGNSLIARPSFALTREQPLPPSLYTMLPREQGLALPLPSIYSLHARPCNPPPLPLRTLATHAGYSIHWHPNSRPCLFCHSCCTHMRSYQQNFFFDYFHDIRCSLAVCFSIGASDSFIKTLLKSKHRWIQKLKEESNTAIKMAT